MKFTEHTKLKLNDTCIVFFNREEKEVKSLPTEMIDNEKYYILSSDESDIKKLIGDNYQSGDKLYLKDQDKNEIIKEEFDHWRAMARTYIFNNGKKYKNKNHNNFYVRCW